MPTEGHLEKLDRDLEGLRPEDRAHSGWARCSKPASASAEIPSGSPGSSCTGKRPTSAATPVLPNPDPWTPAAEHGIARAAWTTACCTARTSRRSQEIFRRCSASTWSSTCWMEDGKTDLAIWLSCSIQGPRHRLCPPRRAGQAAPRFLQARQLGKGVACRRHHVDEQASRPTSARPATASPAAPRSTPSIRRATASRPSAAVTIVTPTGQAITWTWDRSARHLLPRPQAQRALPTVVLMVCG